MFENADKMTAEWMNFLKKQKSDIEAFSDKMNASFKDTSKAQSALMEDTLKMYQNMAKNAREMAGSFSNQDFTRQYTAMAAEWEEKYNALKAKLSGTGKS